MRDWTARPTASLLTLRSLALRDGPASGCLVRMGVVDELMAIERELALGRGDVYARVLHDDAVVVVPGAVLTRAECVAAMDESAGWDDIDLAEPRLVESGTTATVVYGFTGVRGTSTYTATLASTYTRDDGGAWRLLVHQQTPQDGPRRHALPGPTQVNLVVADVARGRTPRRERHRRRRG